MAHDPYVQITRHGMSRLAECHDLDADERCLLAYLTTQVDYTTGDIADTTVEAIAEAVRWGNNRTRKNLARLEARQLIATHLTRGHGGWVAVLAFPALTVPTPATPAALGNLSKRRLETTPAPPYGR